MTVLGGGVHHQCAHRLSGRIGGARRSATGTKATTEGRVCLATDCAEVRLANVGCPASARPGSIGCNRDRRAGSDHCRCTDSQGSMRMFAYHLCETPPVERTAGAFEAHSVSVGGFACHDNCHLRRSGAQTGRFAHPASVNGRPADAPSSQPRSNASLRDPAMESRDQLEHCTGGHARGRGRV